MIAHTEPLTAEQALSLIEQARLDDFAAGLTADEAKMDANYVLASAYRELLAKANIGACTLDGGQCGVGGYCDEHPASGAVATVKDRCRHGVWAADYCFKCAAIAAQAMPEEPECISKTRSGTITDNELDTLTYIDALRAHIRAIEGK